MEELQLHLYGHMRLTAKSLDKHSQQQIRETNRGCYIKEYVIGNALYIKPIITA